MTLEVQSSLTHAWEPSCAETQWSFHKQPFGDLDRFPPLPPPNPWRKGKAFFLGEGDSREGGGRSPPPPLDPKLCFCSGALPRSSCVCSTLRLFRSHDIYFLPFPVPPEVEVSFYIAVIITPCHSLLSCHLISAEWVKVTRPFSVGGKMVDVSLKSLSGWLFFI